MLILVMLPDLSWGIGGELAAERTADLTCEDSRRVTDLTREHRAVKLVAGDGRTAWHWQRESGMPAAAPGGVATEASA